MQTTERTFPWKWMLVALLIMMIAAVGVGAYMHELGKQDAYKEEVPLVMPPTEQAPEVPVDVIPSAPSESATDTD